MYASPIHVYTIIVLHIIHTHNTLEVGDYLWQVIHSGMGVLQIIYAPLLWSSLQLPWMFAQVVVMTQRPVHFVETLPH